MFGRNSPPKMTKEEREKRNQELRDANVTGKEMWAMVRAAMMVIMPVVIGVMLVFVLIAWIFVSG